MGKAFDQLVGRTIAGKFLVEAFIGSGAMGAVYRARQIALEKTVAIKVLHGEHADDPTFAARFQREAKAASRMNHPNSMQVVDFGEEADGLLYIAMEYLDGRSLHQVLREGPPMPPARIADILMQTLAALAAAHDMGVVHRDLKPENIVVLAGADDDGRVKDIVKVCDFGIAKMTDSRAYRGQGERDSNAPVTTAGFLVGTPEYMSPEQGRGDKLDARSDIYSAGVVLFEMLTGAVPFHAENAIGVVLKHITEEPPRPSSFRPGVDPRLEIVCLRALRKRLDERYAGARDMRADLRAVLEGRAPQQSSPSFPTSVTVRAAEAATAHAATVEMPFAAAPHPGYDAGPKPTLEGTALPVPRRKGPLTTIAIAATLTGTLVAGVLLLVVRSRGAARPSAVAEPSAAPATAIASLDPVAGEDEDDDVPPLEPGPAGSGRHAGARTAHSSSFAPALHVQTPPPPPVSAAPPVSPPPAVVPPPATPPAAPPADPDTAFDPGRAYVEVGLINAQGVRESAVRAALRTVGLAGCYRSALKTRGVRATGVATIDLSIDENGVTHSAIVVGADFLPGLARCIQGAGAAVGVAKSQVDPGGGTAEATLAFKAP